MGLRKEPSQAPGTTTNFAWKEGVEGFLALSGILSGFRTWAPEPGRSGWTPGPPCLAVQPQASHPTSLRQGRKWCRGQVCQGGLTLLLSHPDFISEMGILMVPTSPDCGKDQMRLNT